MTFHLSFPIFIQKLQYGQTQLLCIGLVDDFGKSSCSQPSTVSSTKRGKDIGYVHLQWFYWSDTNHSFHPDLKGRDYTFRSHPSLCLSRVYEFDFFSKNQLLVSLIFLYFFHFIDFFWFLLFHLPTLDYFNFLP